MKHRREQIQFRLEKERTNQEMIAHQARPCELHDFIEKLEKPWETSVILQNFLFRLESLWIKK